jgi:two-component system, sensor histidine kinase and response regulator
MSNAQTISLSQIFPVHIFQQVRDLLKRSVESSNFVFTDDDLVDDDLIKVSLSEHRATKFVVVVSPGFSALWQGQPVHQESEVYETALTFNPVAIAVFLTLIADTAQSADLRQTVGQVQQQLTPNQAERQSEFTLQLIAVLATTTPRLPEPAQLDDALNYPPVCQPIAATLHQQVDHLHAQLQLQKEMLAQRVIERTQALRDTLVSAQSANRAKTEFLATMSHELKTPLTCIIGMSATLLRWSADQPHQRSLPMHKQKEYLQTIRTSGEHLLELINDILDLSQVESGKTVLSITEFSLNQLAQQTLQLLRERALQHQVALNLELKVASPHDQFRADARRVRQILINLLSNAIKFTPEQGHVTLRIGLTETTAILQVEDTGIGIPEHQRSLLFQKFQQLESSLRRKYEGTGLGLALTKQLVELHGGWIEVASTVNVGSTFTVHLPRQEIAAIAPVHPDAQASLLHQRIFLIEGHKQTADLICDLLTAADYQVVWMMEGETALKRIEVIQPAVVIINTQFPGIDGHSIIRHLKRQPATQDIKILALISSNTLPEIEQCQAAGANDYLVKPIKQPEELFNKIAALM